MNNGTRKTLSIKYRARISPGAKFVGIYDQFGHIFRSIRYLRSALVTAVVLSREQDHIRAKVQRRDVWNSRDIGAVLF